MAPEVLCQQKGKSASLFNNTDNDEERHEASSPKADVWSLGIILIEVILVSWHRLLLSSSLYLIHADLYIHCYILDVSNDWWYTVEYYSIWHYLESVISKFKYLIGLWKVFWIIFAHYLITYLVYSVKTVLCCGWLNG